MKSKLLLMSLAVLCALSLASSASFAGTKIGVFLFSKETRYVEAVAGFKEALAQEGYKEPTTVFVERDANANKATAAEIAGFFADKSFDLVFTTGTSASVAAQKRITDKPIVFGVVYDPIRAGLAKDWSSSGINTTGVSTKIPMDYIVKTLQLLKPIKKIAVLYTPGELNSELVVRDLLAVQSTMGIKVLSVPLSTTDEIPALLPDAMRSSDAVYVSGSNFVDRQLEAIIRYSREAKAVTFTHLEDLVDKGLTFGVCAEPRALGIAAGKKAVSILRGVKPSDLPIDIPKDGQVVLNVKNAEAIGLVITDEFMKLVNRQVR